MKSVRRLFKGPVPRSLPPGLHTVSADREPCEPWEMFHRSRCIMRPGERSHIQLFTYSVNASLLLSRMVADKLCNPGPLEDLTSPNVSSNLCNSSALLNMKTNLLRMCTFTPQ
jgi:hypothetical protein